jgi:glycosyltransferase involved in cell wall biosynthesis
MKICMIVHNSATRDGRVMREARSLQAAGHTVTLVGIPEANATKPEERLQDGVIVRRVEWHPQARRRLIRSAVPRLCLVLAVGLIAGYGIYRLLDTLFARAGTTASQWGSGQTAIVVASVLAAAVAAAYLAGRAAVSRTRRNDAVRRRIIADPAKGTPDKDFPAVRSLIPAWLPDWLLEIAVEPLDWLGAGTGRFSLYRYRSEALAAVAIALKPDIVHCHDCAALPTGWLVKKSLGIPLIYDAHEIYEAVAARRFGATHYFARLHRMYLPKIDGFVAVNDSAAAYYRHAYPKAPPAIVLRNATDSRPSTAYDGQLHRAAGLPPAEKILLYQGGFTKDRGLRTLVRAAPLLPDGWSLILMGLGVLAGELKQIAETESGNRRKAHILPSVPASELLTWTQGATVGIVPYEDKMLNHWIATPNKLWEYPNAGVPMIVQPFPEMRRIVETYGCGWVLPDKFSVSAIADAVGCLTEEMIQQARIGCKKFAENDNWKSTYEPRLLNLYTKLERQISPHENQSDRFSYAGKDSLQAQRQHT